VPPIIKDMIDEKKLIQAFVDDQKTVYSTMKVIEFIKTYEENKNSDELDLDTSNKLNIMKFGKYKGWTIESIAKFDKRYSKWMSRQYCMTDFQKALWKQCIDSD